MGKKSKLKAEIKRLNCIKKGLIESAQLEDIELNAEIERLTDLNEQFISEVRILNDRLDNIPKNIKEFKNDFREVSEFELLKLNFEKYKDDYRRVKFRKFSWSIIQIDCGDFYYEWIGGNTKVKSMKHLNVLYFNMTGSYLF